MTVVFTHSQSTWNTGGEHLLRNETVRRGRRLIAEGRGRQFVEGGVRPSAKGRNSLSREGGSRSSKEGGSCSLRQGSHRPREGRHRCQRWKEAICRKRMDGNRSLREGGQGCLSREGGCQHKRGRMPAREGGCQHERGRMPAREREEAAVHCGGREEQWISALLGNSKFNDVGISNSVDLNKLQLIIWSCSHSKNSWHRCVCIKDMTMLVLIYD